MPFVSKYEWLRIYQPSTASERKKISQGDPKAIGKFSFSVSDIIRAIKEINEFIQEFEEVDSIFPEPHEGPSEQS